MTAPTRTAQDYEGLRPSVLSSAPIPSCEIRTVCHRGLASWLKQPPLKPIAPACADVDRASPAAMIGPTATSAELTRVIADIVVALALEPGHG